MKKALIVLMVLLMGAGGLFAQEAGTFTLGGRAGMAFGFNNEADSGDYFPDLFGMDSLDRSMRMNFNAAIFAAYTIVDNLSLQLELNIMANQGFNAEFSDNYDSMDLQFTYTSLDIPLLVRYSFFDGMLGVMAGPHLSIPLGRLAMWIDDVGAGNVVKIDTAVTFGLTAGVVGAFPVGPGSIIGDLRFVFDFNSIEAYVVGENFNAMTRRALVLSFGYQLSF